MSQLNLRYVDTLKLLASTQDVAELQKLGAQEEKLRIDIKHFDKEFYERIKLGALEHDQELQRHSEMCDCMGEIVDFPEDKSLYNCILTSVSQAPIESQENCVKCNKIVEPMIGGKSLCGICLYDTKLLPEDERTSFYYRHLKKFEALGEEIGNHQLTLVFERKDGELERVNTKIKGSAIDIIEHYIDFTSDSIKRCLNITILEV